MPKKVRPHDHEQDVVEGFLWDGMRLQDFANFFKGNFCYHDDSKSIVIDSKVLNVGDWLVHEDDEFIVVPAEDFQEDFDLID